MSNYLSLHQWQNGPRLSQVGPKLSQVGPKLGQVVGPNWPKDPNAIGVPVLILALLAQGIGLIAMTTLRVYLKWPWYPTSIQMDNLGLTLKKCSFMVRGKCISHFKMLWSVSRTMPWAKRASLYNHNRYSYCIWIFWPILSQQLGPISAQLG